MKIWKKVLCSLLVVVLCLTSAPLGGFVGLELPEWNWKASAVDEYKEGYYTYTVSNGEATITDVDIAIEGDISVPSTLGDYSVTTIGDWAFYSCDSLTSITIPDSVTTIGDYALASCYNLTSITIPDSVTTIGGYAFSGCDSLTSITIPDSVTTIGDRAFYYCDSLTSVTIPDSVTTIGAYAFCYCDSLTSITIPDSVTTIGGYAFSSCDSLTSITIPDSVTTIGNYAFEYCDSLTSIVVDADDPAYSSDSRGALFDKNKTILIQYPIGNTNSSYSIPNSVTTIAGSALADCDSLTSITIPDSVTTIGGYAFSSCDSLTSITIPDSVTTIGHDAFYYCDSLTSITIGDNVTSIGESAFYDCDSLTDVYYNGTEEQWKKIYISYDNEPLLNATIHFLGEEEEDCTHKETFEQTIPASCTVAGMKFTVCVDCGETIGNPEVIPAAHTPGEWETVIEPTYEAEGKKVKKCTACGETLEEEIIPKLELAVVEDEETGVGLEFPAENYDGKVEIEVEESFDGTAFNILDTKTGAVDKKIYDIKMLVDGEVTQPNGKVKVKLPLPAGYNPNFSFVYYVNTETGAVEKMEATYEDGYMVFETDHFSYYAVITEPDTDNCSCKCHKTGIAGFFWKVINFFNKIFKIKQYCDCGINHY